MNRGLRHRIARGLIPGGQGFFNRPGGRLPGHGGLLRHLFVGGHLFGLIGVIAGLFGKFGKAKAPRKSVARGHHAVQPKSAKRKITRASRAHGIKRPVARQPRTSQGRIARGPAVRASRMPGATFLTGVFNLRTLKPQRRRIGP